MAADDVAPYNQTSLPLASAWAAAQDLIAKKGVTGHTLRVGWKCAEYALSQAFPDNDVRLPTSSAKKANATHKRRASVAIKQLAEGQSLPMEDNAAGGLWLSIAMALIKALLDAIGK